MCGTDLLVGGRRGERGRLEDDVDARGGRRLAELVVDTHQVLAGVLHRALRDRQRHHQLLRDLHAARTHTTRASIYSLTRTHLVTLHGTLSK